jgi:antitoxin component of RelBE/YafQ-DinJ toxin-antitoxin module
MVQEELDRETKKQEAEAIMEQLGLTKEHLKALGL